MSDTRAAVVIVVAPTEADPPALETLTDEAALTVVRTSDEFRRALRAGADVLVVYDIRSTLVREAGEAAARVPWIHAASAGVDAVLTPDVVAGDSVVTNARGVFDRGIAEYVLALLLVFAKDVRTTLDQQHRHVWRHRETESLAARRLLVVGAGSIGRAVARLASACGMHVRGVARTARDDDPDFARVVGVDGLHAALGDADDVVACTPLTSATRGLFDRSAFAAMRPGARFVNVGRGAVVDEHALLDALESGHVSAAGLDVFVDEPLPNDHPFWDHPAVVVSPHMSGDEVGWRDALGRQFVESFRHWRAGKPLDHVVDKTSYAGP